MAGLGNRLVGKLDTANVLGLRHLVLLDPYRPVPSYVERILKGAKPADLPVQSPAKNRAVSARRWG
jgi:hypothetical protein